MNLDPFSKNGLSGNGPSGKTKSSSDEIFVKSKTGGTGRRNAPTEAQDALDMSPPETAPEPEKKKAAVVLRNPKWEAEKLGFNEEAKISVELELPPEHAHKTKVAFELFAKTPKGPERISQGEGNADGGKAVGSVPVYIPAYKDEDGNRMQKVEYYFNSKHSESEPLDGSKAPKLVDELAERLLQCHVLPDVTFGTGKCFIHPKQAATLKTLCEAIKAWQKENPDGKLAVFGHADAVGKEDPNKSLSERRAKSVHAFLMKDSKAWESTYKEEKWGLAPIQDMLRHLGHDPGASDGQDGPKTQEAVKGFQTKKGLPANGVVGDAVRTALFQAMMEDCNTVDLKAKDFDDINGGPTAGCSEFNLIEKVQGASQVNRRVSVLHLKSNKNFPITYPCAKGNVGPCKKQVGRKGDRRTAGFGCFFYDQLVVEQKTEPKPVGPLKFIGVAQSEEKQYVNLPSGKPNQGIERLFEVEAENAQDGSEVFWKITAGKENSPRSEPKTGLKLKNGKTLIEIKSASAECASPIEGGRSSILLCCGLAGGDSFILEAGTSKDKMEVKVTVTNWRKLHYEIMAPDFMSFEEKLLPDGTKGVDFHGPMVSRMKERLGKVFVEYEIFKSHLFEEKDAPKGSIYRSEQLGLPADKRGYVLTDHTFKSYPKKFDLGMAPRSIGLKLCHRNFYFESHKTPLISREMVFKSDFYIYDVGAMDKKSFLPISAENGGDAVHSLTWKAKIDPAKHPGHPAVLDGKPRQGKLDSKSVDMITTRMIRIDLPKDSEFSPGNLVGPDVTDAHCPVDVSIKFEGASEGLGLAGQGSQTGENLVVYNPDFPDSFVDVLLHELGHSMGQTVYSGYYLPPKGLSMPKRSTETDPKYAFNGSFGHVYVGNEHSGSHCAYGLSDLDKDSTDYRRKPGICIMFGENSGSGSSSATAGFCPQCEDYIKSRDLRDLSDLLE